MYRMTHIDNVPHILRCGIVHKDSVNKNPDFVPIGDTSLISCRENRVVRIHSSNKTITLGDYIPFYFGVRMPMLYVIQKGGNQVPQQQRPENIVYIAVSLNKIVSQQNTFFFSDGHPTNDLTTFYDSQSIELLQEKIDWEAINAKYWSGEELDTDLRRRKQAEFLVKEDVPADFIMGFGCYNPKAKDKLISFGVKEEIIKIIPQAYY